MSTILIIEDDPAILRGLVEFFTNDGYVVFSAGDGLKGLQDTQRLNPELVILDVMLPGLSGYEVCHRLRKRQAAVRILMLTARGEEMDRVVGLDLGADDYVTKPFSISELSARVRALLRRGDLSVSGAGEKLLKIGRAVVDVAKYEARRDDAVISLTRKEVELVKYLSARPGQVVRREDLLEEIWGMDAFPTMRTVDNHIAHLRAKLEVDPSSPRHFVTVHGVGYRFNS